MSTENQIRANQENAQYSTGPKTEAGKAASAQNARKHGLSSDHLYLAEGQLQDFQALWQQYWTDICPATEIQLEFFERLVHAKWNINIARELHAAALHTGDFRQIAATQGYLHRWERSFDKALKAIRADQADFALRAIPENEAIGTLPTTCPIAPVTHEAAKIARLQERTQWPTARRAILSSIAQAFDQSLPTSGAGSEPPAEEEPLPQAA